MLSKRSLALAVAGFGALTCAAPLTASAPVTGSGSGTIAVREVTTIRQPGGNVIQERTLEGVVTGTLQGAFVDHVRGVIHKSGLITFHGTMTFTGAVAGCGSGTLTVGLTGTGTAGAPVTTTALHVIEHGRNTLPVHGIGTVHQVGASFTYHIRFHCE
jgi:hypothetical protein